MQSTENPVKIDFIVPQGWHELTDAQLRYVFNLIALELSSEEIAVTCLLHWSGTRVIGRQPDGAYLLQQKKQLFEVKPLAIAELIKEIDWLGQLPTYPVRLSAIRKATAVAADFQGVPFETFIVCDNRIDKLLYAADCDAYFIIRPMSRTQQIVIVAGHIFLKFEYKCRLQPVNLFGGRIVNDDDDAEQVEIEFVPAWIDDTEDKYGRVLFLSFSGYDEDNSISGEDESKYPFQKTHSLSSLEAGEKEKKAEYYDRIYIGWYDGANHYIGHRLPYPNVEDIAIADDWSNFAYVHFSMRINDRKIRRGQIIHNIEPKMKTTFKFISDSIPDVRSVFLIRGKRYIAEKITATFTENGMSQLLKIVCYPIVED